MNSRKDFMPSEKMTMSFRLPFTMHLLSFTLRYPFSFLYERIKVNVRKKENGKWLTAAVGGLCAETVYRSGISLVKLPELCAVSTRSSLNVVPGSSLVHTLSTHTRSFLGLFAQPFLSFPTLNYCLYPQSTIPTKTTK